MTHRTRLGMKNWIRGFGGLLIGVLSGTVLAIEEPPYDTVGNEAGIELRRYAPFYIVSTPAGSDFEKAGNTGFRTLFRYISGANAEEADIAMTAPVLQAWDDSHWSIAFVVPGAYAPEAIPTPSAPGVTIETVAGGLYAVQRFSGSWGQERFLEQEHALRVALDAAPLYVCGPTRYARYNPPFMPPFLRRNEVLIPVSETTCAPADPD